MGVVDHRQELFENIVRLRRVGRAANGSHRHASTRSLAYHQAVARRLRRPMVDEARHVLYRWREQGRIDARYAGRWDEILRRTVHEIRRVLVEESAEADDLRRSPFAVRQRAQRA
jgi:hypothetical protein